MRVDRAFKGVLPTTVQLFDDGMCDGPLLKVGHQYLMYTFGDPRNALPARGCNRSRAVEYADEDLRYLRDYMSGNVTTHISGVVRFRPDEPDDSRLGESGRRPMSGVQVRVSGPTGPFETRTDATGSYDFVGLPPGIYAMRAELPGYRLNWAAGELDLRPKSCVQTDVLMKVDRRVQGVVRDSGGTGAEGVWVDMKSANPSNRQYQPLLFAETKADGSFAIDGIPPGEYLLGINIGHRPTPQQPYYATYYPNTTDVSKALRITVGDAVFAQSFNFSLPDKCSVVEGRVNVITAEGTAPTGHVFVRVMDPADTTSVFEPRPEVGTDGAFVLQLCEGFPYRMYASNGFLQDAAYSDVAEIKGAKEMPTLTLVLNKAWKEIETKVEKKQKN